MITYFVSSLDDKRGNSDSSRRNVSEEKASLTLHFSGGVGTCEDIVHGDTSKPVIRISLVCLCLLACLTMSAFLHICSSISFSSHTSCHKRTRTHTHMNFPTRAVGSLPIHFGANPPFVLWCQTRVQKRPGRLYSQSQEICMYPAISYLQVVHGTHT